VLNTSDITAAIKSSMNPPKPSVDITLKKTELVAHSVSIVNVLESGCNS